MNSFESCDECHEPIPAQVYIGPSFQKLCIGCFAMSLIMCDEIEGERESVLVEAN